VRCHKVPDTVRALHSSELLGDTNDSSSRVIIDIVYQMYQTTQLLVQKQEELESMLQVMTLHKEKELQRTQESTALLLKEQYKESQRKLDDKDKELQRMFNFNDLLLQEMDILLQDKDKRIKFNDRLMQELEIQVMKEKGELNCHGILKWAACELAMIENNIRIIRGCKWYTKEVLLDLTTISKSKETGQHCTVTKLLILAWEKCVPEKTRSNQPIGEFCVALYNELSNAIHGYPGYGPYVKNTFTNEQKVYNDFITEICDHLGLELGSS